MTFALVIRPTRPTFPGDSTTAERAKIREHFEYVKSAFEAGQVQYVGRCVDATFGLIVFEAESQEAANTFAANDPAVKAGIFSMEVREFLVIFDRNQSDEQA